MNIKEQENVDCLKIRRHVNSNMYIYIFSNFSFLLLSLTFFLSLFNSATKIFTISFNSILFLSFTFFRFPFYSSSPVCASVAWDGVEGFPPSALIPSLLFALLTCLSLALIGGLSPCLNGSTLGDFLPFSCRE